MNTMWSTYVQQIGTLYLSRTLRFSDMFRNKYMPAFGIEPNSRILELGCGPGALSESLHRWYPDATVVGTDPDSAFIDFAKDRSPDIEYRCEDATALSFADGSFDVTISNTVAEHVEPSKFFGEQYRVLKSGGVCLVLSARRGINIASSVVSEETDFERDIWTRVSDRMDAADKENGVCRYPKDEAGYPLCMQEYGFRNISTEYITINLTPDNPIYTKETAHAMINANRQTHLDAIEIMGRTASDLVAADELSELYRLINERYDERIRLYDSGVKLWDTNVSLTMIIRGVKP